MITRRVLKFNNDVGVREELNTNKVNEFMESVNNGSTVDDVEADNTYIEIDQNNGKNSRAEMYA